MATSLMRLEAWFRDELPRLNRAVLHEAAPVTAVAEGLGAVLPELPSPGAVTPHEARRLIILLGLAGSSIARHHQEQDPRRKRCPERSFDGLEAGAEALPFRDYFAALAERTGTGHYGRDAYASLVIWNVPTTEVRFRGRTLASLPGVGDDNHIHSYTGDTGEHWFFELVKRGQTIELAANNLLEPMVDGEMELGSSEALRRVRLATTLLEALRRLFLDFATPTPALGMLPQYFMDVFRQFAVHWTAGDIPPSGALDVDALKRDFLLGTVDGSYVAHIERLMPALLNRERTELARLMDRPSLPARLLGELGLDADGLAHVSAQQLDGLPGLVDWYQLLAAHARAAGGHLMLTKRFLFNPQRGRDEAGVGDAALVSNRRGTTGMDESILDRLTRMRREHELAALPRVPRRMLPFSVDDVEVVSQSGLFTAAAAATAAATMQQPRRRRPEGGRPVLDQSVIGE